VQVEDKFNSGLYGLAEQRKAPEWFIFYSALLLHSTEWPWPYFIKLHDLGPSEWP